MAREGHDSSIGSGHYDIDHFDRFQVGDNLPRSQSGRMLPCHRPKRRQKTERHEAGENVRF